MREAGDEAGRHHRPVAGGGGGHGVAEAQGQDQADDQGALGQPGGQRDDHRRTDDHAERVGGDDVPGRRDVLVDAVGDVGQQTHGHELGGPDREAPGRESDQGQGQVRRAGCGRHGGP